MDHAVPGVAGVVDDDVDLAVAKFCSLLDEGFEVFVVEHVAWGSDGLAAALVDGVGDALCLFCFDNLVSLAFFEGLLIESVSSI